MYLALEYLACVEGACRQARGEGAWPFIHCLYFIYTRNFYVRSHGKITQQWKSTLRRLLQVWSQLFKLVDGAIQ